MFIEALAMDHITGKPMTFNGVQKAILEDEYASSRFITTQQRGELAILLGVQEKSIDRWFEKKQREDEKIYDELTKKDEKVDPSPYKSKNPIGFEEIKFLEEEFSFHKYLNHQRRRNIAIQLKISMDEVEEWFANQRIKNRITEVSFTLEREFKYNRLLSSQRTLRLSRMLKLSPDAVESWFKQRRSMQIDQKLFDDYAFIAFMDGKIHERGVEIEPAEEPKRVKRITTRYEPLRRTRRVAYTNSRTKKKPWIQRFFTAEFWSKMLPKKNQSNEL